MTTDNNEQSILEQAIVYANGLELTKEDAHAAVNECNYDLNCIKRILNEKAEKLKIAYDKKNEAMQHQINQRTRFINEQKAKEDEEKSNKLRLQKLNENATQNVITQPYKPIEEILAEIEAMVEAAPDDIDLEEEMAKMEAAEREPNSGLGL